MRLQWVHHLTIVLARLSWQNLKAAGCRGAELSTSLGKTFLHFIHQTSCYFFSRHKVLMPKPCFGSITSAFRPRHIKLFSLVWLTFYFMFIRGNESMWNRRRKINIERYKGGPMCLLLQNNKLTQTVWFKARHIYYLAVSVNHKSIMANWFSAQVKA